jgi:hypothetical protein
MPLVELSRLPILKARGLSDRAIGRALGCSRETVFHYRKVLGIRCMKWIPGARRLRRIEDRACNAELDRLWARLSLDEKIALLTRIYHRGTETAEE